MTACKRVIVCERVCAGGRGVGAGACTETLAKLHIALSLSLPPSLSGTLTYTRSAALSYTHCFNCLSLSLRHAHTHPLSYSLALSLLQLSRFPFVVATQSWKYNKNIPSVATDVCADIDADVVAVVADDVDVNKRQKLASLLVLISPCDLLPW